jgi:hypothetical protein
VTTKPKAHKEEADKLGERRLQLEERAEEEAAALAATLEELLALDTEHRRAVEKAYGADVGASLGQDLGVFSRTFAQELCDWFRGRFGGAIEGIGSDLREGLALPERDALTREYRRRLRRSQGNPEGNPEPTKGEQRP